MTKPRGGRSSALDEKKKSDICAIVGVGCTVKTAAAYVGCSDQTVYRHARKDPAFREALAQARARNEVVLLRHIKEKATQQGEWRAETWLLVHCHQDRYLLPRPEGMTAEQLAATLNRFAEVLVREIADVQERRRVAARLQYLTKTLEQDVAIANQVENTP